MKANNNVHTPAQGVGVSEEEVTLPKVRKWLADDITRAVMCLNAIQSDPVAMDRLAEVMYGRVLNSKNQKSIEFDQPRS